MRALGFEPKKEEIKKMIAEIDKESSGMIMNVPLLFEWNIFFNSLPGGQLYHLHDMEMIKMLLKRSFQK